MARVKKPRRSGDVPRQPDKGGSADALPNPVGKKASPFAQVWSQADNVRILEGLVAHLAAHKRLPRRAKLVEALKGYPQDKPEFTTVEISEKVRSLEKRYLSSRAAVRAAADATEARMHELSSQIWGSERPHADRRGFEEMRCLYPNLSAAVDEIASGNVLGAVFKRGFELMGDEEAVQLEAKVKKQRIKEVKLTKSWIILKTEVLNELINLSQ